ncbi:hypothetical protein BC827DRAFT_1270549 [Russula dissimulans]|nr:hypothetical protein BC827DRAFT_1270549 [Russula dissimulans]
MVSVSPSAKVLVTGANGYLATWVVKKYLEAQYSVRGTGDLFELVVVDDMTKEGAFDKAVKGVDVIAHTASPFHFKATELVFLENSAAELDIASVSRGEPGSTKEIQVLYDFETTKAEELLGLTQKTPESVDFKARGYPGFTA